VKGVDCLQRLIKAFSADLDFQTIISGLKSGMREQLISGLSGSSRQVMISALVEQLNQPIIIVTHNMFAAQKIGEDLIECLSADQVLIYPAQELMVTDTMAASPELLAQRIDALSRLACGFRGILVTPFAGLRKLLPSSDIFAGVQISVGIGDVVDIAEFIQRMLKIGYEREDRVESKGEMSVRGGIIDFFPLTSETPYRIELFDIEVDSIRSFDIVDQRSTHKLQSITIAPCKEIIADARRYQNAAQHASELLQEQLGKMFDRQAKTKLTDEIGHEITLLEQEHHFSGIYKYISFFF